MKIRVAQRRRARFYQAERLAAKRRTPRAFDGLVTAVVLYMPATCRINHRMTFMAHIREVKLFLEILRTMALEACRP